MPDWKYSEGKILCELESYLALTYGQHYGGGDNVQAMDLIGSMGHERSFAIGNIIKYASRQGKKRGQERADILKILHYAIFLLHFHDKGARDGRPRTHTSSQWRPRWRAGLTAVERAQRLHERQLQHFAETQRRRD